MRKRIVNVSESKVEEHSVWTEIKDHALAFSRCCELALGWVELLWALLL